MLILAMAMALAMALAMAMAMALAMAMAMAMDNMTEPTNFIYVLLEEYFAKHKVTKLSLYSKIEGLTRQNFYGLLRIDRVVSPFKWVFIRKAMGMSRKEFWKRAMNFHDPEE